MFEGSPLSPLTKCVLSYSFFKFVERDTHPSLKYLQKHQTKDLGSLKYFLGIEVAWSKKSILLSQRKYVLDLLSEAGMLGCKSVDFSMDVNMKLLPNQRSFLRMLGGIGDW